MTSRAITVAAALVLWLSAAPPMAAAQADTLALDPAHGAPGSHVDVLPEITEGEFDCWADWLTDPGWGSTTFSCGQPTDTDTPVGFSAAQGSNRLWVPSDAAAGPHTVRVRYGEFPDLTAEFTVDAPATSTTSPDPPTSDPDPRTASPSAPRQTPAAPDESTTTEPGTPDSTTTAPAAPGTTTDRPVVTGVVDISRNLPLGLVLLATVIALAAAIAMPKLVRTLRRRTPHWVARNLRVVVDKGTPRTAPTTRSGPATTVRLAVQVAEPRKEGP
jgi:hypothetical protein